MRKLVENMVIIGKKTFLKKDKSQRYFVVTTVSPCTPKQLNEGCLGLAARDVFVKEKYWQSITEEDFHRDIEFTYGSDEYGNPVPNGHIFVEDENEPSDSK